MAFDGTFNYKGLLSIGQKTILSVSFGVNSNNDNHRQINARLSFQSRIKLPICMSVYFCVCVCVCVRSYDV